ncbi:MAG: gamma carbonic anhydrase family protein [Kiritimatiellales bacterium]|nr:gamma carbonic anhydrase family protein [Kiritimatiellales bacterium]
MIYTYNNQKPVIDAEEYFIAENASVIGNVTIRNQANIWFGAVLRGDLEPIEIGERTNVQDNAVVHTDHGSPVKVGRGVTIGHQATIHGCTIGDHCLIGMKATVLDGAVIGDHCIIGAHSLIPPGKEIPEGSLVVGVPGRVVRQVTDEERAHIGKNAEHYVNDFRQYLGNGFGPVEQNH